MDRVFLVALVNFFEISMHVKRVAERRAAIEIAFDGTPGRDLL